MGHLLKSLAHVYILLTTLPLWNTLNYYHHTGHAPIDFFGIGTLLSEKLYDCSHARMQVFNAGGGGGGSRPDCQKRALTTVVLVLNLFYSFTVVCHQWFISKKTIISKVSESRSGSNIFQGEGSNFFQGGGV